MRYAVLLRGINVGGHNKIKMADLKQTFENSGYENVATYIQSGNIAFNSNKAPTPTKIRDLIAGEHSLNIPVVVRKASEIDVAIADNPFKNFDPKKLHVLYLSAKVPSNKLDRIDTKKYLPDQIQVIGQHAYVLYKKDSWSSKLTIEVVEKAFDVTATARNWNTALKLQALVEPNK